MTALGALTKALNATALVVLLSLAWAMPAKAHPGHGSTTRAIAQAATSSPQAAQSTVVASPIVEAASVCSRAQFKMSALLGSLQREGALGRICCGTMCIVALIEPGIAPLPLRSLHGIRLVLPPEALLLARAPSLHARPPRTANIA